MQKRWIWLGSAGAVVLVLVLVGLAGREAVPEVRYIRVARGSVGASIASNGKVEPIEPHDIRSQLTTFVEKVFAVPGQTVKRGTLLLTLNDAETRAELARRRQELLAAEEDLRAARSGGPPEEVARLESDLRKTEAELTHLRHDRDALERLLAKQAASQEEVERNRVELERAEAEWRLLQQKKEDRARRAKMEIERATLRLEQAREAVRSMEEKAASAQVVAPVDGTLYWLPVRPGDFVRVGDPLAEMADLSRVRVRAFVDEPDLGLLEKGQAVEITWDAAPNRVWSGVTDLIPKTVVVRGTRSVGELLCSVDNEKRELLPNTNVNVRIQVRERSNVLVVPRGAVHAEGGRRYVFLVGGGRLRRREIRVGISSPTKYEVLEGLAEGDRVVLPGDVELRDGLEVRSTEQK